MPEEATAEDKACDALFEAIARLSVTDDVEKLSVLVQLYDMLTSSPEPVTSNETIHAVGETAMLDFDPRGTWWESKTASASGAAASGFTSPRLRALRG